MVCDIFRACLDLVVLRRTEIAAVALKLPGTLEPSTDQHTRMSGK